MGKRRNALSIYKIKMSESLIEKLVDVSPVLAVCVGALYLVSKRLFTAQDAHLDSQRDRINALEKSAAECERSRAELYERQDSMQRDVIDKLMDLNGKTKKD